MEACRSVWWCVSGTLALASANEGRTAAEAAVKQQEEAERKAK